MKNYSQFYLFWEVWKYSNRGLRIANPCESSPEAANTSPLRTESWIRSSSSPFHLRCCLFGLLFFVVHFALVPQEPEELENWRWNKVEVGGGRRRTHFPRGKGKREGMALAGRFFFFFLLKFGFGPLKCRKKEQKGKENGSSFLYSYVPIS